MRSEIEAPLTIYIDYSVLPANQAGVLLLSLENLYQLVAIGRERPMVRLPSRLDQLSLASLPTFQESALALETAQTGNSITLRFAGRRQPAGFKWSGSDAELILPRWSAAAVGVGALLLGAMHVYDKWLDLRLKSNELQRSEMNFEQERAELEHIRAQIEDTLSRVREPERYYEDHYRMQPAPRRDRYVDAVTRNVSAFHSVVHQPNIRRITINNSALE